MGPKDKSRHPKGKSRHPKDKSRHPKDKSRHPKDNSRHPKDNSRHPKDNSRHPHLHSIASEAYRARHLHNRSLNHAKALIENQPDSIEGHKRAAQDLLKLGLRNEAILIIEQLIQRNKSKKAAAMASKLFKVAGQTSRSLVLTTQLAKANDATDD